MGEAEILVSEKSQTSLLQGLTVFTSNNKQQHLRIYFDQRRAGVLKANNIFVGEFYLVSVC